MAISKHPSSIFNTRGLTPRDYQVELARKCARESHLIVLPTGLGKTLIAAMVAGNLLGRGGKGSKIIILAPTRPLVAQHVDSFQRHLDLPSDAFILVTGQNSPTSRPKLFAEHRVLFMTPETLRNDLENALYSLEEVCMIVFDEAHHARGDYAYVPVARVYHEQNVRPIVLGLTASPGTSTDKVSEILTNLQIPAGNIVSLTKRDREVKQYVQETEFQRIPVELPTEFQKVLGHLQAFHEGYLQQFEQLCAQVGTIQKSQYKNAKGLSKLMRWFQKQVSFDPDNKLNYLGVKYIGNLLRIHHYIDVVETQGLDVFLDTLGRHFEEAKKKSAAKGLIEFTRDPRARQLLSFLVQVQRVQPELLIHPKTKVLCHELNTAFEQDPNTRVLIFAKLRDTVNQIVKAVKTTPVVRASKFVGQSSRGPSRKRDKGMSQKIQLETLEKFRAGEINVLVATNVAEEGLDIVECDLVIMYDVIASEIRMIQREGRTARHRAGRVVILYTRGTRDEINFKIQGFKRSKMQKVLRGTISSQTRSPSTVQAELEIRAPNSPEPDLDHRSGIPITLKKVPPLFVRVNPLHKFPWDLREHLPKIFLGIPIHFERGDGSLDVMTTGSRPPLVLRFLFLEGWSSRLYAEKYPEIATWANDLVNRYRNVVVFAIDDLNLPRDFQRRESILNDMAQRIAPAQLVPVDSEETLQFLLHAMMEQIQAGGE